MAAFTNSTYSTISAYESLFTEDSYDPALARAVIETGEKLQPACDAVSAARLTFNETGDYAFEVLGTNEEDEAALVASNAFVALRKAQAAYRAACEASSAADSAIRIATSAARTRM